MTRQEFKQLFDEHFEPLRRFLYYRCGDADLATDIAQDTFVKIWEKKPEQPGKELVGLLYKMAKDALVSTFRHQQVEQKFAAKPPDAGHSVSPEEEMSYNELAKLYEQALSAMPEGQREVFLMSRNDELKYHEIAERLDISVKAVEKRMSNALQYLREALNVS